MKVSLERMGGWGGAPPLRPAPSTIDAADLRADERAELERLVEAALAEPPPETDRRFNRLAAGASDITVEREGRSRTITIADADADRAPAATALRRWIERRGPT